jgi:CRP-like cAMP-binding protein
MKSSCSCEHCDLKELFIENLESDHMEIVCSGKVEKEYAQGETIIKEGMVINDFIYLKSGLVKLFKRDQSGKEQIITIAKPMDYISLLSVFSNANYQYSVSALENSVTCNLKMEDVKSMITHNGALALSLLNKMSNVADRIILESAEIRRKHLRGRVAHLLIYFSRQVYLSPEFDLPLTRKEMGEYVGMTTENVIRSLSEFRKDGILKIYGKTIFVANMEMLEAIADFG